eukprot:jgi/Tetstr1/459120/TSEL_004569.t1
MHYAATLSPPTSYGSATSAPVLTTWGCPSSLSCLLELYKDSVYDANIARAAKTTARHASAAPSGGTTAPGTATAVVSRENFKTTRPGRETVAPRATTFAKGATKDYGKGMAKAEPPTMDKAE